MYTRTKPWTTVDSNVGKLSVPELCMLCDIRLIFLGNNRFGELKCKPEILSPLPRPLPVKHESPNTWENCDQIVLSPTKELVVGVLDAGQSSCTLMTLPSPPAMSTMEDAQKSLTMKLDVGTDVETQEPPDVETSCVETSRLETQPDLSTDNPSSLSLDTSNLENDLSVSANSKTESIETYSENQATDNNKDLSTEGQQKKEISEKINDMKQSVKIMDTDKKTSEPIIETETETKKNNCVPKDNNEQIESSTGDDYSSPITPPVLKLTSRTTATPVVSKEPINKGAAQQTIKIRACTVRLEILTESDIIKHVHIRRKTNMAETVVETVETATTEKTSSTRTIVTRSSSHTRPVTTDGMPSASETRDTQPTSPPRKKQRHYRPRREPSKSRLKSDSFRNKQQCSPQLRRSPRISASPSTPSLTPVKNTPPAKPSKPKVDTPVSAMNKKSAPRGRFETQSFQLK